MNDEFIAMECAPDLKRHFQHYMELMTSLERIKLQEIIRTQDSKNMDEILDLIEVRMAFLRGAVRIATLLCVITIDESKNRYGVLEHEQELLRTRCLNRFSPQT